MNSVGPAGQGGQRAFPFDEFLSLSRIVDDRLSATVVRLENFRYATFVGYCMEPMETLPAPAGLIERYECLKYKETRTNFLWHLFYALQGDF